MIYQKYCNIKRGLILIDTLIAMSLAVLFVVIITQSSENARNIFEFSKERGRLLDVYEAHTGEFEGMMPYEFRNLILNADGWNYSTTTIVAYAYWYGNDRIQTDITITNDGEFSIDAVASSRETNTSSAAYNQSLTFNSVRVYPFSNPNDSVGTPFCSVDFSDKDIVGSYAFVRRTADQQKTGNQFNRNPQELNLEITPIILPIDSSIPLTDLQVRNGKAYISTDSTRQSDPDILIVDIHDSSHANLIAGINTGPGISAITLAGDRVFAAVTSRIAQFQVIKMSSLNNLLIESSYKLPLPYATATPALGSAILYDRNRVYLGTEKWDGEEFNIINVSDPAHPVKIGGFETGSKVGAIFVRDGIAYVAASDEKQLRVIDAQDPTNPILLDSFKPSGWERQEGKSLSYFEDSLQFGRTSGGFNIKHDYELFSWSSSTLPYIQSAGYYFQDISGGIYGTIADRSFIYAISHKAGSELVIFDHSLATSTAKILALPATPQSITCDNGFIYVLAATSPVIYQISFK